MPERFHRQARWHDATITREPTAVEYSWQCRVDGETFVGEAQYLREAETTINELYGERIHWSSARKKSRR